MEMKRAGKIQYLDVAFDGFKNSVQGFTTKHEGLSRAPYNSLNLGTNTLDQSHNVDGNRNLFARAFGIYAEHILTVKQTHGTDILVIDEPNDDISHFATIEADAIITNQPEIMIGVAVADCAPIIIAAPSKGVIAAVHAGWQGTSNKIAAKTVEGIKNIFGVKDSEIYAAIGPSILSCCYEVDLPVKNSFIQNGWDWDEISSETENNHWKLNISEANRKLLIDSGVNESKIDRSEMCVCCQKELFFSYRRDNGDTGRQLGFIMLKKG